MVPTSFAEADTVLGKPPDMTHEQCEPLSVLRALNTDGTPVVVSCWKCTAEELAEINRTGRVWLTVFGVTMQPVCLHGVRPFDPAPRCDQCGASLVVCRHCRATWCLDHQPNPLVCPGCGARE